MIQIVVVNGIPINISADPTEPLASVISRALEIANYQHIPRERWEVRTSDGGIISQQLSLDEALYLCEKAEHHTDKLWVSLTAGYAA